MPLPLCPPKPAGLWAQAGSPAQARPPTGGEGAPGTSPGAARLNALLARHAISPARLSAHLAGQGVGAPRGRGGAAP
jgi:hypothetical protein